MKTPSRHPIKAWTQIPVTWVLRYDLKLFQWHSGQGGNETAALMVLAILGHYAHDGISELSYAAISEKAGISRAKVSAALDILEIRNIIERNYQKRGVYRLKDFEPDLRWAKFPAKGMYSGGNVRAFQHFTLRNKNELNAMKLYFLFAALRDNDTNFASVSYDNIEKWTGIGRSSIRAALSVLAANTLVHIEQEASSFMAKGDTKLNFNRYRLANLDSYRHAGTAGRAGT